jgi:hypothetical protein
MTKRIPGDRLGRGPGDSQAQDAQFPAETEGANNIGQVCKWPWFTGALFSHAASLSFPAVAAYPANPEGTWKIAALRGIL